MKKWLFIFGISCCNLWSTAQILNPVKWSYTAKKVSDKVYDLYLTANVDNGWHIYSQDAGEGPVSTSIIFNSNPIAKPEGKVKEVGKLEKAFDKNFNSTLKYYNTKVDFIQRVKLRTSAKTVVKGTLTYMVCNDNRCLPPKDVVFTINVPAK